MLFCHYTSNLGTFFLPDRGRFSQFTEDCMRDHQRVKEKAWTIKSWKSAGKNYSCSKCNLNFAALYIQLKISVYLCSLWPSLLVCGFSRFHFGEAYRRSKGPKVDSSDILWISEASWMRQFSCPLICTWIDFLWKDIRHIRIQTVFKALFKKLTG